MFLESGFTFSALNIAKTVQYIVAAKSQYSKEIL